MNILYEVMSTNSDKYQNIRLLYPPLYIYKDAENRKRRFEDDK